jgi:hypothetical protein
VALSGRQTPSEVFSQKDVIKVRIGKPISVNEQNEHTTLEEYSEFFEKKTLHLAAQKSPILTFKRIRAMR